MEFCAHPPHFWVPPTSRARCITERIKETFRSAVSASFAFSFALVGTLLGAITGSLVGQETERGFLRGAVEGAFSGAVFSNEVYESTLILWRLDESGIECLLYLIEVIGGLLTGRLVHEQISLPMLNVIQSQMGAAADSIFEEEVQNFLDLLVGSKGLPGDSVEKIPTMKIDTTNITDASGESASCLVCLEVATDRCSSSSPLPSRHSAISWFIHREKPTKTQNESQKRRKQFTRSQTDPFVDS
ncbi:hypothetical protein SAY87_028962 [Trapa incisa]|uniref:NEP1-interacting protein 1 n=1 Tax=Trapa incisa TaxID=236973 RepID=A0AAN7QS51_9MYRT|nr:hypothetical protein SAY87_028962 [Trapa incisa]